MGILLGGRSDIAVSDVYARSADLGERVAALNRTEADLEGWDVAGGPHTFRKMGTPPRPASSLITV